MQALLYAELCAVPLCSTSCFRLQRTGLLGARTVRPKKTYAALLLSTKFAVRIGYDICKRIGIVIIYGEYLFLENFITGWLLLLLTGRLLGESAGYLRLTAAAVLCGLSSFALFAGPHTMTGMGGMAARGVIVLLVPYVAFGAESFRKLLKKGALFLGLTMLSGGAAMAFLLWQQIPAVSGNGSLYMEAITYLQLLCWGILAFGLSWWFVKLIRHLRLAQWTEGTMDVVLSCGQKARELHAALDTGNCLCEPVSGRPVILVDRKGRKKLGIPARLDQSIYAQRFVLIPFKAVGTGAGLLEGLRTDCICFGGKKIEKAVLAFYDGDFGEAEALMNREVLNYEILENDTEAS